MQALIQQFEQASLKAPENVPDIRTGDTVKVKVDIYEGRILPVIAMKKIQRIAAKGKSGRDTKVARQQTFEGTVIAVGGQGVRKKVTVRKLANGVGVEKTFFIHSPRVSEIEVVRHAYVRRAKLYFLRDRVGKATRLREKRDNVKSE
jgi:large subunit ribosomal protein L19